MVGTNGPLVTIGIPVFQGENYLEETLESARAQDYPHLEIVVADNASTDATPDIVARHVAEDPRIRVTTNSENLGAAENYNVAFRHSLGDYFAWNAHDDIASPDFISEGVKALESDPDAVVAVAHFFRVDERGAKLEELPVPEAFGSPDPAVRFRAAARSNPEILVFSLLRTSAVNATRLHGHFTGSDRNLISELMLHGHAVETEAEFYLRDHADRSVHRLGAGKSRWSHPREEWFAGARGGEVVFPNWRRLGWYFDAVSRTRGLGPVDRIRCYGAIFRMLFDDRLRLTKYLFNDVVTALVHVTRRPGG